MDTVEEFKKSNEPFINHKWLHVAPLSKFVMQSLIREAILGKSKY